MTSETDKDKPAAGSKDQRPHAMLDLTATEVFPESTPQDEERKTQAALPPADPPAAQPEAGLHDDPAPDPDPAPSPRPSRETGLGSFLTHMAAGLIGAALALIIAFYLFGNFRERFPFLADRAAEDFRRHVAAAEQRIAALESAALNAAGNLGGVENRLKTASEETAALKQEIAAIGGRIQALEEKPAAAPAPSMENVQQSIEPLSARLAELETRVGALTKAQEEQRASTASAALSMAVQNLRRAVAEGKPFASELKTLELLAPEPLDVASLEARRESGLASLTRLQRDFDASAKAAVAAAHGPGDGSLTGDLLAKARSLVRVRPMGDVAGNTPEAILARAEQRLDSGDLPGAIREAGQLTGAAADAMRPWLTEAKARASADETLAKLEAKLMTALDADGRARRGG